MPQRRELRLDVADVLCDDDQIGAVVGDRLDVRGEGLKLGPRRARRVDRVLSDRDNLAAGAGREQILGGGVGQRHDPLVARPGEGRRQPTAGPSRRYGATAWAPVVCDARGWLEPQPARATATRTPLRAACPSGLVIVYLRGERRERWFAGRAPGRSALPSRACRHRRRTGDLAHPRRGGASQLRDSSGITPASLQPRPPEGYGLRLGGVYSPARRSSAAEATAVARAHQPSIICCSDMPRTSR